MHIYLFDVHREKRKMYRTRKKDYSKKGWAKQPYSGLGSRINQFVIGLMWYLDRRMPA